MASFSSKGFVELEKRLSEAGVRSVPIAKMAVYDGAKILADEIRKNTPSDSGELVKHLAIHPIKESEGVVSVNITFDGVDEYGMPYAAIAAVLETGKSWRPKHAFIRPSLNNVRNKVIEAMSDRVNTELKKTINGKG